jgi:hypothetical protein
MAGDEESPRRSGREPSEKLREAWKKLSPEEREARIKEWRKTNNVSRAEGERRRESRHMSPEERAAKRREIKGRLEKRIAELRARQMAGALTSQERRELERREQVLKRFEDDSAPRLDRPKAELTNAPKRVLK